MLRMELGISHPHCQCCLGSTVVHTLLFLLLSYSLDQPTNYSHFSAHGFYSWREEGSWERRRGWWCLRLGVSPSVLLSS